MRILRWRVTPRMLIAIIGVLLYDSIFFITDCVYHEILLGCLYCVVLMLAFGIVMIASGPGLPENVV
jgi:hypothetical protein